MLLRSVKLRLFLHTRCSFGIKRVKAALLATILSSALLLSACDSGPSDPAPKSTEERFQAALDNLRQVHNFPGATAAFVLPNGSTSVFATGRADIEQHIAMRPTSRMLAGSIGKMFVAALALNLAQEGKLDLDDKLATWLGDEAWFPRLHGGDEITLRMLLHHTTGIFEDLEDPDNVARFLEQFKAEDFDPDEVSLPLLVEFALDHDPLFRPGQGHLYTDTNYLILGMVIEKATGSTYYEQVKNRFLDPLNLVQTEPSTQRTLNDLANGYLSSGNIFGLPEHTLENGVLTYNPGIEWTGGGLVSTVGDLVRWAKALFEGEAMTQPYVEDLLEGVARGDGGEYGLGISIDQDQLGTHYYHGGFMPGYRSFLVYYPDHKIAIAIQINRDYNLVPKSFTLELAKIVAAGL